MKLLKMPSLRILLKLCFGIVCFLQCVILFKEYLNYPTVQIIYIAPIEYAFPAIAFCHSNQTSLNSFVEDVKCFLNLNDVNFCNASRFPLVRTRRKFLFCVTYFSQLNLENIHLLDYVEHKDGHIIYFESLYTVEQLSLHSPLLLPQLAKLDLTGCLCFSKFKVTNVILKPTPYDTNSFDYALDTEHLSKAECKLRCQSHNSTLFHNKISRKYQQNKCLIQCRPECYKQYYQFSTVSEITVVSDRRIECNKERMIRYYFQKNVEETFVIYLKKMPLLYVFIQTGGLLSLWFGFTFIQFRHYLKYRITAKGDHIYIVFDIYRYLSLSSHTCCF